jgi:YHS domain-containing protein
VLASTVGWRDNSDKEVTGMAKDPVCGMTVDEKKAAATATQDGKTYYFCSAGCKEKFTKNPQQYRS